MTASHRHPERIAVGIDGSLASHAAVRWAVGHARPGDTVVLCHAWQPSPIAVATGPANPADDCSARVLVQRELARVGALPRDADVTVSGEVLHGDARDCLCAIDADLVVVGTGGHGTLVAALLGSVSTHLAHHARAPLVIVPYPGRPASEAVAGRSLPG